MFTFRIRRFLAENLVALTLSLILFASIALQSGLIYKQSKLAMHQQLDQRLRTAAALAAQQFTGEELDQITGEEDMETPLFADLVARLENIRSTVPNIDYAYIMRKTADPMTLEFVADADALLTFIEMDENNNGLIDPEEEGSYPGDTYDVSDVPAMQEQAFVEPTVDEEITVDQWGHLISGYAPIYRSNGTVAGIIGLDMDAAEFVALSEQAFSSFALVTLLMIGVVIVLVTFYIIWERRIAALRMLDRERASLLALTTHQLGGPISSIRWWLEMMKDEGECEAGTACAHIETSVEKMNRMVQDLIKVERQEHGKITYNREQCNVSDVLVKAMDMVTPSLKEHHEVHVHVDENLQANIDPLLIRSAVTELLENAMWYSDKGAPITLMAKQAGNKLHITVADKGMGVRKREHDRIFQKFTRGTSAARYRPNGSGLGLYVVQLIMKMAGGSVVLKSKLNQGSEFTLRIPS